MKEHNCDTYGKQRHIYRGGTFAPKKIGRDHLADLGKLIGNYKFYL